MKGPWHRLSRVHRDISIFTSSALKTWQCSPFLLSDRWLFFVANFYSVFLFFRRCAYVRVIATKIIQRILYISNVMVLLATEIKQFYFTFNMSLLILLSLVIFLSKRDFITIFFKSFDFSVDSFAFSTKICFFLSSPQMFMAVLQSNSESSGPCIEIIINPCNMVFTGIAEVVKIFSQINISVILQSQIIQKHLHVDYNPLRDMLVLISSLKLSTVPWFNIRLKTFWRL